MDKYIIEYKNSLSENLCKSIINKFNLTENKTDGVTVGGLKKDVKRTTEVYIYFGDPEWLDIENILHKELNSKISDYLFNVYNHIDNEGNIKQLLYKEKILTDNKCFQIQRYEKNEGFYKYHTDDLIDYNKIRARHITFIWYLNTVEEGGETEFWGYHRIKPETGKLVLFPACWTYPHTGLMPISSDKYIITGWLYKDKLAEEYLEKNLKEQPLNTERINAEIIVEDNDKSRENTIEENNRFI
jgi:hypothetical protein